MTQFPCGQARALVARAGFVDPDVNLDTGFVREVNRRRRGTPVDRRQPAGIAVREDVDSFPRRPGCGDLSNQLETVSADSVVDLYVERHNLRRFIKCLCGTLGWLKRQ